MSSEGAVDSGSDLFGRFGQPREKPQNMTPMNPEMARSMASTYAHIEAQRLEKEAEMNTAEGRKKAAEAKLADKRRKESNWFSRVIIDRGNGWKPIWGSAEDQELRIYTLLDGGEHRFWGIKPIGMNIYDFWEKYDPEVTRYKDKQQETPVNPDAPTGPLLGEPQRSLPPPNKAAAKPKNKKRQITPRVNPTHRVRKSATESPKANKSTRKSLVHKVDAGHLGLEGQVREAPVAAHANGRITRDKTTVTASGAQQKSATEDGGSAPSKRSRGRPPAKEKLVEKLPKQKKTPAVKGNTRVKKSSQTEKRPSAPSTHKMRTRGKGPAELLQLQ